MSMFASQIAYHYHATLPVPDPNSQSLKILFEFCYLPYSSSMCGYAILLSGIFVCSKNLVGIFLSNLRKPSSKTNSTQFLCEVIYKAPWLFERSHEFPLLSDVNFSFFLCSIHFTIMLLGLKVHINFSSYSSSLKIDLDDTILKTNSYLEVPLGILSSWLYMLSHQTYTGGDWFSLGTISWRGK